MPFHNVKLFPSSPRRLASQWAVAILCVLLAAATGAGGRQTAFWRPVVVPPERLGCLAGATAERVLVSACREVCAPIPWQLDERDPDGRLALADGPEPNPDHPPEVIDANDEIVFLLEDTGRPMRPEERPAAHECGMEIEVRTGGASAGRAYAFVLPHSAPRSPHSYVRYDPHRDVLSGRRVALGFGAPTPRFLALLGPDGRESPNLLDRLAIRVSTRFFGLIPVGRNEGHIGAELVAYRAGPVRVIRRQRLWVYVGFGIRSQLFTSDAVIYRDFAELPVNFRLNYPPTHFFWPIDVKAFLAFFDLRGWQLRAPHSPEALEIGRIDRRQIDALNATVGDWFALQHGDLTLVEKLRLGQSLASVKTRLLYAETTAADAAPDAPLPAVGFRLTDWNEVGNGEHSFTSVSYALPVDYDLEGFLREEQQAVEVEVEEIMPREP